MPLTFSAITLLNDHAYFEHGYPLMDQEMNDLQQKIIAQRDIDEDPIEKELEVFPHKPESVLVCRGYHCAIWRVNIFQRRYISVRLVGQEKFAGLNLVDLDTVPTEFLYYWGVELKEGSYAWVNMSEWEQHMPQIEYRKLGYRIVYKSIY